MRLSARSASSRRRGLAIVVLFAISAGVVASLSQSLVSCARTGGRDDPRPLSAAEAARLAAMRLTNFRDGRSGLRATIGQPGSEIRNAGWVDWQRPMTYLSVVAPAQPQLDGLVQAMPGIIATRPSAAATAGPLYEPPATPPADGWRVRLLDASGGAAKAPLDTFVTMLFIAATDKADSASLLAASDARWLRHDRADGVSVDVILGPFVPPAERPSPAAPVGPIDPHATAAGRPASASPTAPAATSLSAMGGAVRYYLDKGSRVRREETLLGNNLPIRVDFRRDEQPELVAIDELGGARVAPRAITAAEAKTLATMRQRDRAIRGGKITIMLPTAGSRLVQASGWLDWHSTVAYLSLSDPDDPKQHALLIADATGVATRMVEDKQPQQGLPPLPLPAPRGKGWTATSWAARADKYGAFDLELLLSEALSMSGGQADNPEALRKSAVWLRTDAVDGVPVTVYEIPKGVEKGVPKGEARLRYWVDGSGALRRLEVRTRTTAFGYLDLEPGKVPSLKAAS